MVSAWAGRRRRSRYKWWTWNMCLPDSPEDVVL
jgi:hypothetical protein